MDQFPLLELLIAKLPLYIIWLVAVMLALVNWKKSPVTSICTTVAVLLMFVGSLIDPRSNSIMTRWYNRFPMQLFGFKTALLVRMIMNTVLTVSAWVFILIAIFSKRKEQPPKTEP
jgi:hypothetical protein